MRCCLRRCGGDAEARLTEARPQFKRVASNVDRGGGKHPFREIAIGKTRQSDPKGVRPEGDHHTQPRQDETRDEFFDLSRRGWFGFLFQLRDHGFRSDNYLTSQTGEACRSPPTPHPPPLIPVNEMTHRSRNVFASIVNCKQNISLTNCLNCRGCRSVAQ